MSYQWQKTLILILFLTVPVGLLLVFSIYPACYLLYLSFTSWDGTSVVKEWIGWANYRQIFMDPVFFRTFSHNFSYFIFGFVQIALALYLAVILNGKIRAGNFFKSVIFLPYIINSTVIGFMFLYVFKSDGGAVNILLNSLGLESWIQDWLSSPSLVNHTMAAIAVWKYTGVTLVIFYGGLKSIPNELYEAANIDGATGFKAFRYITLPSIKSLIELSLFLNLSGALGAFEFPFIMTKGGPFGASDTFITKTVDTAFKFQSFGLASALGIVFTILVVVAVTLQQKLIGSKGGEE
ncbi:carbohydrate ABC transporter permease [Paenibacillus pectinilyticus]|nr:sugar ABC transporter permease [Paenibacillus pectinilyticus]